MNLVISQFSEWDNSIFDSFISLKKELQGHLKTYFPETLEDYKKLLHPDSPFSQDYEWRGFLLHEGKTLVGKAILAWRKNSKTGNLGFIDWINNQEVANTLMRSVEEFAKKKNLEEIKTPIDLNFFVKYLLKSKVVELPIMVSLFILTITKIFSWPAVTRWWGNGILTISSVLRRLLICSKNARKWKSASMLSSAR